MKHIVLKVNGQLKVCEIRKLVFERDDLTFSYMENGKERFILCGTDFIKNNKTDGIIKDNSLNIKCGL